MALPDPNRSLVRTVSVPVGPGERTNRYVYATKVDAETVLAAGHFNFARNYLRVNDRIMAWTRADDAGASANVELRVAEIPSIGDVTVTGGSAVLPPDIAPATNWRLPITAAYDSGEDAGLVAALVGSEDTKARPSFATAPATPRTVIVWIGEVAEPGGIISYVNTSSSATIVASEAFDATPGTDGSGATWGTLPSTQVSPTAFITNRRQTIDVPPGPPRALRFDATTAAASNIHLLFHQLQADGRNDAHVVIGASLEASGMLSLAMEQAIIAAHPEADPIVFNYALAGAASAAIQNHPPIVEAAWGHVYRYVYVGNVIGNDITANQPISGNSQGTLDAIRGRVDTILTGFPGKEVFPVRTTFRAYAGVTPEAPEDGSLPYNEQIVDPAIAEHAPQAFDEALGVPRIDLYATSLYNRNWLMDAQHYNDYGWMRAEAARVMGSRIYDRAWPPAFARSLVARLEDERLYHLKREAGYAVASLPDAPGASALAARVAAVNDLLPSRVKIDQSADDNKINLPDWNNTARITVGVAITNMITEDGWKSAYGWSVTAAANNRLANGGFPGADPDAEFPPDVVRDLIVDTVDSMAFSLTGASDTETYRIKALASRASASELPHDFVVSGQTQTVNARNNLTLVADFQDLSPDDGAIGMTINRGDGNTTGVYLNGVIIEVEAA